MKKTPLIAIVGRPNVGKSALFNRLSGQWTSIVEDLPGITRDCHTRHAEIFGNAVTFMDTGGLMLKGDDVLSRKVRDQTLASVKQADLILFVVDGRAGMTAEDEAWLDHFRKWRVPRLYVVNKIDRPDQDLRTEEFAGKGMRPLVSISAEMQRNFSGLNAAILKCLGLNPIDRIATELESTPDDKRACRLAIIGRPNVGKSSLMNALTGRTRSVTHDAPGTTRDTVHDDLMHDGFSYSIADTAGIRKRAQSTSRVEKFSIMQAMHEIDAAEIVLLVMDGMEGPTAQDAVVAGYAFEKQRPIVVVVNKWDLGAKKFKREEFMLHMERTANYLAGSPVLFVSARTGKNLDKIFTAIRQIRDESMRRLKTGELNRLFEQIQHHHAPPVHRGRNVRFYYVIQTGIRPPTFVFFVSDPKGIHFSYTRYLINALKEALKVKHATVRVQYRGKKN